jgi:hypothetical protein
MVWAGSSVQHWLKGFKSLQSGVCLLIHSSLLCTCSVLPNEQSLPPHSLVLLRCATQRAESASSLTPLSCAPAVCYPMNRACLPNLMCSCGVLPNEQSLLSHSLVPLRCATQWTEHVSSFSCAPAVCFPINRACFLNHSSLLCSCGVLPNEQSLPPQSFVLLRCATLWTEPASSFSCAPAVCYPMSRPAFSLTSISCALAVCYPMSRACLLTHSSLVLLRCATQRAESASWITPLSCALVVCYPMNWACLPNLMCSCGVLPNEQSLPPHSLVLLRCALQWTEPVSSLPCVPALRYPMNRGSSFLSDKTIIALL